MERWIRIWILRENNFWNHEHKSVFSLLKDELIEKRYHGLKWMKFYIYFSLRFLIEEKQIIHLLLRHLVAGFRLHIEWKLSCKRITFIWKFIYNIFEFSILLLPSLLPSPFYSPIPKSGIHLRSQGELFAENKFINLQILVKEFSCLEV